MTIVSRLLESRSTTIAERMHERRSTVTDAGEVVTRDRALRHSAVWAATDLVSEVVSTLPVDQYRRSSSGDRTELALSPVLADPDPNLDPIGWRRAALISWLLRGNVFGFVLDVDDMARPTGVELLDPDRVSLVAADGRYRYKVPGGTFDRYPLGPIVHWPAFNMPGSPVGLSPIAYAAQAIGLGLAAEKFAARFFAADAHPVGALHHPGKVDDRTANIAKRRIREAIASRDVAILGDGFKWEAMQVAPEDSQFLETTRANVATIARYFRVPPEMIGGEAGGSLTYANVEQRGLAFLTYCVGPWVARLESCLSGLLARGQYAKVNVAALARVDMLTRYQAHDLAIRSGLSTVNERRALEDLPPVADGDVRLWPPYSTAPPATDPTPARSAERLDVELDAAGWPVSVRFTEDPTR